MAQEIVNNSYYYDKIGSRFIDIDLSCELCIEKYFSTVLFNGDYSKMCYSALDSTFRRRIETLDKGKVENQQYTPISLDLPYGSYFRTSDWEDDDRFAAKQSGQMLTGQYDMNFYRKIRSRAVKAQYTATFFFSRQDEIRAAKQVLDWEASPKGPTFIYDTVSWKGCNLNIPVFITIDKIDTKPNYNELDWLQKQRLFPIEVQMTVRSYQVLINNNGYVYLPFRFPYPEGDNDKIYLTHLTALEFSAERFELDIDQSKVDIDLPEISEFAAKYFDKEGPFTNEELNAMSSKLPGYKTTDILRGYFSDSTEVSLNYYKYVPEKSTMTKAHIAFQIKPSDRKFFTKMEFLIPGRDPIIISDCKQTFLEIDNLHPNSEYKCIILTYSTNGECTTYRLTFTTKEDPNSKVPTPKKINKLGGLVGMSF